MNLDHFPTKGPAMASAKTRSAASRGNTAVDTGLSTAADLGRQQMVVATESAAAMFRGFEAIRKIQEQAAHTASTRHSAALEKLKDASPADMVALQAELMRFDFESAAQYWQQLSAAALEMESQMMGCANHLVDSSGFLEATSSLLRQRSKT
jgi:hypothetical protein